MPILDLYFPFIALGRKLNWAIQEIIPINVQCFLTALGFKYASYNLTHGTINCLT